MRVMKCAMLLFAVITACAEPTFAAEQSETWFVISGDLEADVSEASASLVKIRNKIPAMNILSSPTASKELGGSFSVNLFFPSGFEPAADAYPVEFAYRSNSKTLGGSVLAKGKLFSHDTKGTAEFTEFGEKVRVRFEFEAADKSQGREGRELISVRGEAVCDNADIFD